MILDPQVADAVDPLARLCPRADTLDDDRSGLLSALVATGRLPGFECGDAGG